MRVPGLQHAVHDRAHGRGVRAAHGAVVGHRPVDHSAWNIGPAPIERPGSPASASPRSSPAGMRSPSRRGAGRRRARRSTSSVARPAAAATGLPLSVPAMLDEVAPAVRRPWSRRAADVAPAGDRGEREAAADDLAEGGQVRDDAVVLLRAARTRGGSRSRSRRRPAAMPWRAVISRSALRNPGCGHDQPLQRLHDDRGQLVGVRLDDGPGLGQVVEGRDQHLVLDGLRDARRVGLGRRERLGGPAGTGSSARSRWTPWKPPSNFRIASRSVARRGPGAGRRTSPRCRCRELDLLGARHALGRSARPAARSAR